MLMSVVRDFVFGMPESLGHFLFHDEMCWLSLKAKRFLDRYPSGQQVVLRLHEQLLCSV